MNNNIDNKIEIIKSSDGSHTLFRSDMNEHYHSVNGAITEALHVFISAGLKMMTKKQFNVLEIGFGTGLNAFLTALSLDKDVSCKYLSIEKYPLQFDVALKLNYADEIKTENSIEIFRKIHSVEWESFQKISPQFSLMKHNEDLNNFDTELKFDLIYFDAFGPDKQPEMWRADIFQKLYNYTNENGILVTYSAKGDVRRAMISAGYEVGKIAGPPGKRHMLRARKL